MLNSTADLCFFLKVPTSLWIVDTRATKSRDDSCDLPQNGLVRGLLVTQAEEREKPQEQLQHFMKTKLIS